MVIQIPNPLFLPQSYGMGEVAGMSFGSNYVILMQIGYRYYAPRIIEEMEKGELEHPMNTLWWAKWQKFMKTYSDQSIQNTMDRTLAMPDKILDSIWEKMSSWLTGDQGDEASLTSASTLGTIQDVRYSPSHDRDADLKRTQDLLDKANKALKDAYDYAASDVNPRPSPPTKPTTTDRYPWQVTTSRTGEQSFTIDPADAPTATSRTITKTSAKARAPTQIIKNFNLLNAQMKALESVKYNSKYRNYAWKNIPSSSEMKMNWLTVLNKASQLVKKYDLVGKVNTSHTSNLNF